ncbi:MAG: MFS transporter [Caldimicrobium sp.]
MVLGKLFWISILYFFSGVPFGFFYTFLPVFLRSQGVDLVQIGLISGAGIFWSLKPLWAPWVDRYFFKIFWISFSLLGMGISVLCISFLSPEVKVFWYILFLLPFFSALYDTALDGFIMEYIPKEDLGKANGLRISAYRIALVFSGGLLVALSDYFSHKSLFFLMALLLIGTSIFFFLKNEFRIRGMEVQKLGLLNQYYEPIKEILKYERVFLILLFIATYKIGDALLGGMIYPFWVDKGFTKTEIGIISGTIGVVFTILGSLIGGYYIRKIGIKKSLFFMGGLQAVSNLGYTIVAHPSIPKWWVYLASIAESFTGGLGTSAFITFLTLLCRKDFSSTHYALFSMLFSTTLVISRTVSGYGAKYMGYLLFFGITFFIALLPLFLIPLIFRGELQKKINDV